ncbi:MAG: alpha-2-macroglobulin [Deltaproteobacteria bacterium]|nr:alpha-2-macroglobulin [Deltaproteobacteria bacterium]
MTPVRWVAVALLAALAHGSGHAASPTPAALPAIAFFPQGSVKQVRQATARFPRPMVALGDPRAPLAPFAVACPAPGTGRWIDSRTWSYDFAADLLAGLRCSFTLVPGVRALDGTTLASGTVFRFDTGGPSIRDAAPYEGSRSIEEDQAFILALDAEVDPASIAGHVGFEVAGLPERIAARVVTGAERDAIVKAQPTYRRGPHVVVRAAQAFPNGAKIALVWGPGVATTTGVATTVAQRLAFQTRDAFTVTFSCLREKRGAACNPVGDMRLEFSAPVTRLAAEGIALLAADGTPRPHAEVDEDVSLVNAIAFPGPFPENTAFRVELPAGIADESGRTPVNAARFPLAVGTGELPPLAKFNARFGIVESKAGATLPVTLRNLEPEARARVYAPGVTGSVMRIAPGREVDVLPWLRRVGTAKREVSVFGPPPKPAPARKGASAPPPAAPAPAPGAVKTFTLPKPNGERAFEVVGIPFERPGLYVVELESARLGASLLAKPRPMYVPTVALVTNLSVHFKWGAEQSVVWVTTLDAAKPVAGAAVTLRDCRGGLVREGTTDADGLARLADVPAPRALPTCYASGLPDADPFDGSQTTALRELDDGLLVTARSGDDASFVHSSWDDGIEPWRYDLPDVDEAGGVAAHTILDRPLFRAGEVVHLKHVFRTKRLRGFGAAAAADLPTTLSIVHVGSDEHFEQPLALDASGVGESTWTIPREAKLGYYEVHLLSAAMAQARSASEAGEGEGEEYDSSFANGGDWIAASFRVEEFRVPLMKGVLQPPAGTLVAATSVPVDLAVRYLAGGAAAGLPVVVRAQVSPLTPETPEDLEGFTLANGPVEEGVVHRGDEEPVEDDGGAPKIHQRLALTLDDAGTGRATITDLAPATTPVRLRTELEFRDPTGQVQTVSSTMPVWPATRLVAIAPDEWAGARDTVGTRVAVVDPRGAPVAGAPVRVDAFSRKLFSHRTRVVGGFYAYDSVRETKRLGTVCRGTTDAHGLLHCEGPAGVTGNVVLEASTTDESGRRSAAHHDVWVAGKEGRWWFGGSDSDRMDVLPERRRYEPGETARLQVRMPFRAATALVTIEREGVADARVVALAGTDPVIEVPIRPEWAPNVFVSVLALRGRADDVQPTALVDLGRPTFKLGIAELAVGWKAHELKVRVAADHPVHRVRETAQVKIAVRAADGTALAPGSEVALAAVDAGLLELAPNESWKLLDAMMGRRSYGVTTATAQMQVVGKRHYGLKALPAGGGGGRSATRELFDTLLLWKARVPLDARGRATVDVPLNDSLTSFRIVAVAASGLDRFGTGGTSIRATQDVMILPGLAPLVREGDRFRAAFTVRNTTSHAADLTVAGTVEAGGSRADRAVPSLAPQTVRLPADASAIVGWDMTAPADVTQLTYTVTATAAGAPADEVRVAQQVRPAVPVRTLQAALLQLDADGARQPVARPADALPERGEVRVALAPSLAAGLDGVRDAMRRYPYRCLEQRVSRAIALHDDALWHEIATALPSYADAHGLLKYFPTSAEGSEVLTAYVLSLATAAGRELPGRVRADMEEGLRRFVSGALATTPPLATADLALRKITALEALSRVGAVEPALMSTITVEPGLWPTSALIDWWSLMHRIAKKPDPAHVADVEHELRARLRVTGTSLTFSTEDGDRLFWLMSDADVNAVRLVLTLLEHGAWREDLPRLARGALGRQRRGAWSTTVANAWGTLAVEKFAAAFETTPVAGTTRATLADTERALDWAAAPAGAILALSWPSGGEGELALAHAGGGRPWATIQARAAVPLTQPIAAGYRITKTVTPVESAARPPGGTSRDDVLRVRLEIDAERDMTWVVVDDPIPAGATHLGTGLGGDSAVLASGEQENPGARPVFVERAFDGFRAYYDFVPKGRFTVEYTMRLSQAGRFALPPTRVEALYAPDVFGEIPNAPIEVAP